MPSDEDSDNPWGPEDTFWRLVKDAEKTPEPMFILRGDVVGVGHDGEPLIQHIEIFRRITLRDIMSSDLRWAGVK